MVLRLWKPRHSTSRCTWAHPLLRERRSSSLAMAAKVAMWPAREETKRTASWLACAWTRREAQLAWREVTPRLADPIACSDEAGALLLRMYARVRHTLS